MMGKIGYGYGSEWHLLRYLGRHRELLDKKVRDAVGAKEVKWLDFPFKSDGKWQDDEWKGVDFLDDKDVKAEWAQFWPQTGNIQNWDAVGYIQTRDDSKEWILLEAKDHVGEIRSNCGAKSQRSRTQIEKAFEETKKALCG